MNRYLKVYAGTDIPEPISMPCRRAYVHRVVLWRTIGWGPHPCHWCGVMLEWQPGFGGITGDHLNGDTKDNSPANLVASCSACNRIRAHGVLDLRLPERAAEILTHSPIKTHFPCGHPLGYLVDLDNVYVITHRGVAYVCWECHRTNGRDYFRRRAAEVAA